MKADSDGSTPSQADQLPQTQAVGLVDGKFRGLSTLRHKPTPTKLGRSSKRNWEQPDYGVFSRCHRRQLLQPNSATSNCSSICCNVLTIYGRRHAHCEVNCDEASKSTIRILESHEPIGPYTSRQSSSSCVCPMILSRLLGPCLGDSSDRMRPRVFSMLWRALRLLEVDTAWPAS